MLLDEKLILVSTRTFHELIIIILLQIFIQLFQLSFRLTLSSPRTLHLWYICKQNKLKTFFKSPFANTCKQTWYFGTD